MHLMEPYLKVIILHNRDAVVLEIMLLYSPAAMFWTTVQGNMWKIVTIV